MRHVLNLVTAAIVSMLIVIGWKPILGLETFDVDIKVTALGTRDAPAKGSEVWLRLEGWPAGVSFDDLLASASPKDGWERRDDAIVSYRNQPASLTWKGTVGPDAKLVFTEHDWSGNIEVTVNGSSRTYDLYREVGASGMRVIILKQVPAVFRDSLLSVSGTILPAVVIALLSLAALYGFQRRRSSD